MTRRDFARPKISPRFLKFFARYSAGLLRRNFEAVRLLKNFAPLNYDGPLVIFLNHASWWDPLACLFLARKFFPARASFAPIEAEALRRYRFFARLGFFGVEKETRRGAAEFLRATKSILASENAILWITPQGKFADVRARPIEFRSGLARLARDQERVKFLPLALEYTFWEERRPEILLAFGKPVTSAVELEAALEKISNELAAAAQRRRADEWELLLESRRGVHFSYDLWRRARAFLRGEKFRAKHSEL